MDVVFCGESFTSPHKFLPWSSEALQSFLKLYEVLWSPLKLYDALWSSMKPSKALWRTLQISLRISRVTDRSKKSFCLSPSLLIQRLLSDKLFSANQIIICHQSSHNTSVCILFIPRILLPKNNFKRSIIKCNFSSLELS